MSAAIQPVPAPAEVRAAPPSPRKYSRVGDYAVLLKMRVTSLVVMTALLVGISMWWFTNFEYVPREDAE